MLRCIDFQLIASGDQSGAALRSTSQRKDSPVFHHTFASISSFSAHPLMKVFYKCIYVDVFSKSVLFYSSPGHLTAHNRSTCQCLSPPKQNLLPRGFPLQLICPVTNPPHTHTHTVAAASPTARPRPVNPHPGKSIH